MTPNKQTSSTQPLVVNNNNHITQLSLPLAEIFGVAFVILKLCHQIDWTWIWVLSPFWIWFGLSLLKNTCVFCYRVLMKTNK